MEDWVKLRHECSPLEVFTKLRMGAELDVEARNSLRKPQEQVAFRIVKNGETFAVLREGPPGISASVEFKVRPKEILITPESISPAQRAQRDPLIAKLTLTNEGECKLKVGEDEFTCAQFRKKVLEDLLFNF